VQQIGGNLVSALLVPIVEIASRQDYQILPGIPKLSSDIRGDVVMLMIMTLVTSSYFSTFNSQLRRSMADDEDADAALDLTITEKTNIKINSKSSISKKKLSFWER
jgi:FLVCR family feline leukemia virus subgroup C receptor-related protein